MKKKILFILIAIFVIFSLSACNRKREATGYAITHKDYVGYANIRVANGTVDFIQIDEVYLPNTWAKVVKGDTLPDDVIDDGTNWYGKYLVIGEKQFTGTLREAPLNVNGNDLLNQTVKYSAEGIDDLYLWLKDSEANMEWYVKTVIANKAFVAKADWTKTTYESAGKGGWTKASTNYWPPDDDRLGWSGNMTQFAQAIKGTKMDAGDNISKNEDGYWVVNGVLSGATLASFKDYYELARRAFTKANSK